ncbi:MAG: 3-dehydroquinate synthase [Verrucomicrobiota bacterium]
MTTQLNIHTPGGDYPIHIGSDLEQLFLEGIQGYREMIVVTDETVEALPHFQTWRNEMNQYADHYLECLVPAGETSKSVQRFSACLSQMAGEAFSRSSLLVALGGGVVGDLGGFLAASYLRGIDFIQVPTTLLAMVDSSVGGKTGINLPEGKNLVGAFYQPQAVFADLSSLSSLSPREFSAGMAEVIKYGLIRDPELLSLCAHPKEMELATIITRCVQIKADVVAEDEKETSGLRAILNFGHTLGHAIEQTSGYGKLLHGEAVSLGMIACPRV